MWAHSANGAGVRHRLEDHLRGTAALAAAFAQPFGLSELAWWAGLAHDGGKAWCEWQRRLLEVEASGARVGLDHKSFGVQLARRHALEPAEWVIAGHHGGLTCRSKLEDLFGEDAEQEEQLRMGRWADAERCLRSAVPELFSRVPALPVDFSEDADPLIADFAIRFLFSCLVDADLLDTQAHRESSVPRLGSELDQPLLLDRFLKRRAAYLAERPTGPMDDRRGRLFDAAMAAAGAGRGVFRLTAPTGTAKTIAAAGFALRHAQVHGLRRVVVAVPFITITEQNAAVYRQLLDPEDSSAERVVLEHHSQVGLGSSSRAGGRWQRAAAENWSSPFVVTTTVQLFESLFGRTQSRMRKLHRLANSVIVLDEVQALPHRLLPQIADAIRILSQRFGVTVVLSSATQPELQQFSPLRLRDFPEIAPDPVAFFAECQRVRFRWRIDPKPTLAEIVTETAMHRQSLLVLNTVKDAKTAFLLAAGAAGERTVLHLSTGMCPAHRRRVLAAVSRLLEQRESVLLISTSLVEAGVDIDFPVAFRAIGPPESLAQVAGRCNREDRLGDRGGLVVIFDPVDGGMPPSYRTQIDKASVYFGPEDHKSDPDNVDALARYFRDLYRTLRVEQPGGASDTIARNRRRQDFEAVADGPIKTSGDSQRDRNLAFCMLIEDTVPVVVPYPEPAAVATIATCLAQLRGPRPDMAAIRDLQPYTTTLRRSTAQRPDVVALLKPVVGDLHEWTGRYDDGYGIVLDADGNDFIL